jgi:Uncharacterised protein family (UPF0175)
MVVESPLTSPVRAFYRLHFAVMLFQKEKLTPGQASKLNHPAFQHLLANRQISVHYEVKDFMERTSAKTVYSTSLGADPS